MTAAARAQRSSLAPGPVPSFAVKRLLRAAWSSSIDEQLEREWLAQRQLFADADTGAVLLRMTERWRRAQSEKR